MLKKAPTAVLMMVLLMITGVAFAQHKPIRQIGDWEKQKSLSETVACFHAQYRQDTDKGLNKRL